MITFPIPTADFFGRLKIRAMTFQLSENTVSSTTGAGQVIRSKLGASLWSGALAVPPAHHEDAADLEVMADMLRRPGASFLLYDNRFNGPKLDFGGALLGASTPVLSEVNADQRRIRIDGLPVGYTLSRGDYIGFVYGAGLRAMHRVVDATVVADATGETPLFEVLSTVRPGFSLGVPISLVRPTLKAVLSPNSLKNGAAELLFTSGLSLEWSQTLR